MVTLSVLTIPYNDGSINEAFFVSNDVKLRMSSHTGLMFKNTIARKLSLIHVRIKLMKNKVSGFFRLNRLCNMGNDK